MVFLFYMDSRNVRWAFGIYPWYMTSLGCLRGDWHEFAHLGGLLQFSQHEEVVPLVVLCQGLYPKVDVNLGLLNKVLGGWQSVDSQVM